MRTGLTNKVKLDIVKRALPTIGLKSLLESTLPAGTAPADDKWEDALPRLAKELKRQRPGHPATPRTSGNARDHLATPGPIWQRQVPYGNAKCDLDAADAPQDS